MNLKFSDELSKFQSDVRKFIKEKLPEDIAHRVKRSPAVHVEEDSIRWRKILHEEKGWSVPHWPVEYGGTGWSPLQQFIFEKEAHEAFAPQFPWQNTHMIGPVIYTFGSQFLKDKFLPAIRAGDFHFAQGFSEPGSGSDLASLSTSAELIGDHYIINGQKLWTSGAAHCKWIFALVKTDKTVKPQKGISMILVPLDSPGVTVRPIMQLDHQEHLCEVFFDNVKVGKEYLVGQPGDGWMYGKFLLDNERTESSFIYWSKRELEKVKQVATQETRNGKPVIEDPVFQSKLACLDSELMSLEWSVLRVLSDEETPYHKTAVASSLKVKGSDLQQRITELQYEALGMRGLRRFYTKEAVQHTADALCWPDHVPGTVNTFLWSRSSTIQGGAKQIQLGIISKLGFGL